MRGTAWSRSGTLIAAAFVAAAIVCAPSRDSRVASDGASRSTSWHAREVARIQEHLAGAERVLLDANTARLTAEQRAARAMNVALLRGYRERGEFPRNIDFPDERQPYFVDDRGVLCAMAYLIACSGGGDIVEKVRSTRNNARVRDLADDPALVAWLDDSGLTLAEAARIQPEYGYGALSESSRITAKYGIASAAASMANGVAIVWNLVGARDVDPHRWRGALGAAASAVSIGLGYAKIDEHDEVHDLAVWNLALGAVSFGVSAHSLIREGGPPKASSAVTRPDGSQPASLSLAPMLGPSPGLQLALSF